MRVRSYITVAVLVTALGGSAVGGFLFWRQATLDQEHAVAAQGIHQRNDVTRFADHIQQLLISTDLLFGSHETYMLGPSAAQLQFALELCAVVARGLGNSDHEEKAYLKEIHQQLELLNSEVVDLENRASLAQFPVDTEQLARVDGITLTLVDTTKKLALAVSNRTNAREDHFRQNRSSFDVSVLLVGIAYLVSVAMVLWWASRSVNRPLSQLSEAARLALDDHSRFKPAAVGPTEVEELTDHIGNFVESLNQNVSQYRALIDSIPDTLFVVDRNRGILEVKPSIDTSEHIWERLPSGRDLERALGEEQTALTRQKITTCLDGQVQQHFDIALRAGEDERHYEARATPITMDQAVIIIRDLTSKHHAETRIRHMAYHDGLTGLLNRRAFKEGLTQHFESELVNPCALLYLDVDRFKSVNDSQGHEVGDSVLRHISECLANCLRAQDTSAVWSDTPKEISARIGGDEFVVLLPGVTSQEAAESVASRLLSAMAMPFSHDDTQVSVTVSIGVALYPQHGDSDQDLLNHADLAMFQAKRTGGNSMCVYEHQMGERSQRKLSMETRLRRALADEDLFLVYQPKINLSSGSIVGAEALVRWRDVDKIIPPDEFIPLAEETGLILPLGDYITATAVEQAARWHHAGLSLNHMAINVSAAQLRQDGFCSSVSTAVDKAQLPRSMLNIEITESLLMGQYSTGVRVLNDLREAGFNIAMDDFGTGYSSLSYIKNLPLDVLKIDRTFVSGIATSPTEQAIIIAIITLGQTLGLRIVAEGVETRQQARFLLQHQCNEAQGYLFSPPVLAEEFEQLLTEQQDWKALAHQ